jgi:hypothetical protein
MDNIVMRDTLDILHPGNENSFSRLQNSYEYKIQSAIESPRTPLKMRNPAELTPNSSWGTNDLSHNADNHLSRILSRRRQRGKTPKQNSFAKSFSRTQSSIEKYQIARLSRTYPDREADSSVTSSPFDVPSMNSRTGEPPEVIWLASPLQPSPTAGTPGYGGMFHGALTR